MLVAERIDVAARLLGAPDAAPALVDARGTVSYGDLRRRVSTAARELALDSRSVVVVTGPRTVELVVSYLAVLHAGHVPLLAGDHVDELVASWDPAAVVRVAGDEPHVEHRHDRAVDLHPDLCLLMSTSGSTGSPKLVRLCARNVASNADAIATMLRLTPADRGITTLPLHYCYGLSVLHSHLAAGASVVLSEASVVDPCFIDALARHGVTNVAGVPHTYDLVERAGAERLRVRSLRLLTVAGGKLPADRVGAWLGRAERWGAEFVVMYGQTEATARMAYLPPALAARRPGAIGVPIPGGELRVEPVDGAPEGIGELVYRGANVMMGYADRPDDLALGHTLDELRTGDLGRYHADDGVFEVVGRRSRFVKPFGVRIDLDRVESVLRARVGEVAVAGDDDRVVVVAPGADAASVEGQACEVTGLPASAVVVDTQRDVPRTRSGKVDHAAVLREVVADAPAATQPGSVAAIYRAILAPDTVGADDSFVSLGGDSLAYVECSLQLERVLGRLPQDWHLLTVAQLEAERPASAGRRLARLDTTALLRAIGICCIVGTHMHVWFFPGGAHLMLAVAGYNLSRFLLPIERTADRVRAAGRTIARTAGPVVAWVALGLALGVSYGAGTLLLVNNYIGPASHREDHWHFWFVEVFVHLVVIVTAIAAIPALRRLDRRLPYGFPLALFAASLLLRMEWAWLGDWYNLRYRTHGVAWFFLLGWLVHRSHATWQRVLTTLLCAATVPGFFDRPQREWFIAAGLVLLVWARDLPVPRLAARVVGAVAAATLWILITHFTVWPPLDRALEREVAYVLTIAMGVAAWWTYESGWRVARRVWSARRARGRADATAAPALPLATV